MGIDDDIRGALTVLQGGNNEQRLPAVRQEPQLPAERTQEGQDGARERVQRRQESLPANREQEAEDERIHPDERTSEEGGQREVAPRKPLVPVERAPAAWRAGVKEKWSDLPVEVREEITRREREIAQTLSRTDTERRYANEMFNAVKPYEALLNKLQASHVDAVKHLLEMAHTMHTAPVQQRAELIAELFFRHEVPIQLVDQVLVRRLNGQGAPADPIRNLVQQELAPVRELVQQMQQARTTATSNTQQSAKQELQALYDDPDLGDMVDEVREDMADLLDLASKRGQVLPLRDAAVRAILAHPEFGSIYQQRQLERKAQQQVDKTNRARRAGASLSDDGAPTSTQDDDATDGSIGADLRASIAVLSRSQR